MSKKLTPLKLDPLPEWFVKLTHFVPRFPGDGFNHTLNVPLTSGPLVNCPCGAEAYVDCRTLGAQVVTCPQCSHWHSVIVARHSPVLGGEFILTGTNQT